ncbi:MAG: hypothetical protein ACREFI_05775 [Stellaceae bacterium]
MLGLFAIAGILIGVAVSNPAGAVIGGAIVFAGHLWLANVYADKDPNPTAVPAVERWFCKECGAEIAANDPRCRFCGAARAIEKAADHPPTPPLAAPAQIGFCTACGQRFRETDRFCGGCGAARS